MEYEVISELIRKTLTKIEKTDDEIHFHTSEGEQFRMFHYQDCCEHVYIEDITGELDDLIGSPLTMAEEAYEIDEEAYESGTWTFYKFATNKGYVTIRWYGSSNGYYSESVSLVEVKAGEGYYY
ncbi:DUF7448 domain-containing protein [Bacillus infantis]|uniref:DUF7448 domain-containing protein n=1 Tax=Bacillus infantis TaxID=324767 RepID=UPI0020A19BB0|nr:hypothetical protein [Bacillus infantis]MCP1159282.1 hypothetical protein [Bacillus infantis]